MNMWLRLPSLPALTVLALLMHGCNSRSGSARADATAEAVTVQTAKPVRRDVVRKLAMAATLDPWEQTTLYAKANGYVREIRVDRGDRVKKGDLVAVLDVPEASLDIARIQAEERQAKAAAEQAASDVRLNEVTARRLGAIRAEEQGAVSEQEVDVANGKLEVAKSAAATAQSRVGVLRAEASRLSTLAAYAQIKAPFDGVVTDRFVDVGALVTAGNSKTSAVVRLVNPAKIRVVIDVPETDVTFVTVGRQAAVIVDAIPGDTFHGTIARRSDALDPTTRTMRIEVEIDNADGRLVAGMFGRVRLDLETRPNVLTVEPAWMKLQKDQAYVFVAQDGVARRVNIKIGADDGKVAQVVEGLNGDEDIITSSVGTVKDGAAVAINPARPAAGK